MNLEYLIQICGYTRGEVTSE